jgi:mannose-1-phosphate guanylyltransferase
MAGGAGERFWPRSRRARPKPLLRVAGAGTLLEGALARAALLAPPERTWVVCTQDNAAAIRAVARLARGRLLVEPRGRNTGMAVGLAAARIGALEPDAVLVLLPADHAIRPPGAFAAAVRRAARAAAEAEVLVTLGVRPTRPETGYGYIAMGAPAGRRHPGLHRVRRFVEKPDARRARAFLRRGGLLWNAGIFVWKAAVILEEMERHAPALARALAPLRAARGAIPRSALERAYRLAPALPIDVAVLERSRRVWTLPVRFRWTDLGSWDALAAELGVTPRRSRVVAGDAVLEDAPGNLIWGGRRPIALLGVSHLAVIDTNDALLVARLDRSADVRRVVARLREAGLHALL